MEPSQILEIARAHLAACEEWQAACDMDTDTIDAAEAFHAVRQRTYHDRHRAGAHVTALCQTLVDYAADRDRLAAELEALKAQDGRLFVAARMQQDGERLCAAGNPAVSDFEAYCALYDAISERWAGEVEELGPGWDGYQLQALARAIRDAALAATAASGDTPAAPAKRLPNPSGVPGTNTGHGHVWKRPDGIRARCGGPALCSQCAADAAALAATAPAGEETLR